VVVTGLGVYRFDEGTGEMELVSTHPGVTADQVRANTGWDLRVAPDLSETPAPTADELRLIREELDPEGAYTR
jgi:glutaconate CoA-transferase subunit B